MQVDHIREEYGPVVPAETTWQQRLGLEYAELKVRYEKLDAFTRTDTCAALPPEDRSILHNQAYHMEGYLRALERRLARLH